MIKVKYIVNIFLWDKYVHKKKNEDSKNLSETILINLKHYLFFLCIILARWIQ